MDCRAELKNMEDEQPLVTEVGPALFSTGQVVCVTCVIFSLEDFLALELSKIVSFFAYFSSAVEK